MNSNISFKSLTGQILVAHPNLRHEAFRRSVIWISDHTSKGAHGLIVNRPLSRRLSDIAPNFAAPELLGLPVYEAGPVGVERILFACWHKTPDGNFHVQVGLSKEHATHMVVAAKLPVRVFIGHAEWTSGQLEDEIRQNVWLPVRMDSNLLCNTTGAELWRAFILKCEPRLRLFAGAPDEPANN